MAEGSFDFGYDDPDLDYKLDHDDDDDDDDKQEVNTTRPFQPGAASTPYHSEEQHEMQTMQHEQSGLSDTSYEETPLLSDFSSREERQGIIDNRIDDIKKKHPKVDFKKLGPIGFSKKGTQTEIVLFGPKGGETKIFKKDGSLLKSFTDRYSKALGPSAEQILAKDRDSIQKQRQILLESERQLREAEKIAAEKEKEEQESERLKQEVIKMLKRINVLEEEHSSNLEAQAELQRLKQLKKNYETELEKKKKEIAALKKIAKNKETAQKKSGQRTCKTH